MIKGAHRHQERNKGSVMRSIENELSDKKGRKIKEKQRKPKMLAVFLHGWLDANATMGHPKLRAGVLITQRVRCT